MKVMYFSREFGGKRTKVTYHNYEEWGWVHPRGVILAVQQFFEVMGMNQPPQFPQDVTIRTSTLAIREWELRSAGECPPELSPYSETERLDMMGLANQIKTHMDACSAVDNRRK